MIQAINAYFNITSPFHIKKIKKIYPKLTTKQKKPIPCETTITKIFLKTRQNTWQRNLLKSRARSPDPHAGRSDGPASLSFDVTLSLPETPLHDGRDAGVHRQPQAGAGEVELGIRPDEQREKPGGSVRVGAAGGKGEPADETRGFGGALREHQT